MNAELSGGGRSDAEYESTIGHEVRLAELVSASPDIIEAQRPRLWGMVETGLASCVDGHSQQAMQLTGHVIDWQLFGGRGDRLPPGLVWLQGNLLGSNVDYDLRKGFSETCRTETQKCLDDLGLNSVISAVSQDIESRHSEIHETVRALIATLPEFRLVQSFNMQLPPELRQMPLSPFFRMIREQQVEEGVKRQYGIQGPIDPRSAAAMSLKRRLQGLDDETMPRRVTAEPRAEALARARDFFGERVFNQCFSAGSYRREALWRFDIQTEEDYSYLVISIREEFRDPNNPRDHAVEASDYVSYAAGDLVRELDAAGTPMQQRIGDRFLYYFMRRLLDPRTNTRYNAIVEEAAAKTAAWIFECFSQKGNLAPTRHYDFQQTVYLRQPEGERIPDELHLQLGRIRGNCHQAHSKRLGFTSEEELVRQDQTTIGEVLQRPQDDSETRLIQSAAGNTPLPRYNPKDELRIKFTTEAYQYGADPHIPGYKLSSRNEDEYGFVRDSVDPYTRCTVPLSDSQKERLAEQYAELGLRELAKSVHGAQHLTVDGLVGLLRSASYYPRPAKTRSSFGRPNGGELPSYFEANQLPDFQQLVKEGVLQVQCNGTARFLQLSLEAAFGRGCANTAGGNLLLRRTNRITAQGHAQTTFVNDGHVYLLDATPFSATASQGRRFDSVGSRTPSPQPVATLSDAPAKPNGLEVEPPEADPDELRTQHLVSLQYALEMQLTVLLGAHDRQDLFEKALKLSTDDPIRRTLEVFLLAPKDEVVSENVESLIQYLENYKEAPADVLAQMRVPTYDPAMMDSLINPLHQLRHYL